jgi:hypothetical protein
VLVHGIDRSRRLTAAEQHCFYLGAPYNRAKFIGQHTAHFSADANEVYTPPTDAHRHELFPPLFIHKKGAPTIITFWVLLKKQKTKNN